MERELFFVFGKVITLPGTCRVHVAKHLHISAKRQKTDFPAGSFFINPAKQFRPETN